MSRPDRTLDHSSLYGSARWVSLTLGVGYEAFRKYLRAELESDGLPEMDPVLKRWKKSAVIAWAESRTERQNEPQQNESGK